MTGRFGAALRAVGALALSSALVIGIPLLLIATVGNPFPGSLPSIDEIQTVLTQNGQGFSTFLISSLAIIVWFVWLQLLVAFVVELTFAVRGRETPRLPTAPGIQALTARLVASMTLAATLAVAPLLAPAAGALELGGPVMTSVTAVVGPPTAAAVDMSISSTDVKVDNFEDQPKAPTATLAVAHATELWDLSEAAYGDGVQWKLIAGANAGSQDASGNLITNETEAVPAGTLLKLPGELQGSVVAMFGELSGDGSAVLEHPDLPAGPVDDGPAATGDTAANHVIEPGDSMWSLAEAEVERRLGRSASDAEIGDYWFDVVAANQDVSSGDPDLIFPGDDLAMPGATPTPTVSDSIEPAPGPDPVEAVVIDPQAINADAIDIAAEVFGQAGEAAVEQAVGPVGSEPASTLAADPGIKPETDIKPEPGREPGTADPNRADDAQELPARQLAVAAAGTALFASGIVAAIGRRRDLQRRLRMPQSLLPTASTEAAQLELALRHRSDQVLESSQGNKWRLLPAEAVIDLRDPSARELRVDLESGTKIVDDCVESESGEINDHRSSDTGPVGEEVGKQVGEEVGVDELVDQERLDIVHIAPSALILGTDPISGEAVLLDLERASTVELIGSAQEIRRFVQSAVLDLAVSDRAADLCVVAVGIAEGLNDLERVRCVDSMAAALVAAVNSGHASSEDRGELSTPLVVVATAEPVDDEETIAALVELGAIVLGPGLEAEVRLTLNGDRAHIWPTGTVAVLATLTTDEFEAATELVEVTKLPQRPVSFEETLPEDTESAQTTLEVIRRPPTSTPLPGQLEVQVLGPVDVAGAKPFSSVKAVDVIAYLAFHRHGVDADQIKTWVWPGFDPPTNKAFANVMSRARAGLGVDAEGEPYLSKAGADKTYRLAAEVTSDFERFVALVELADGTDEEDFALEYLRQALDLIRGVPFTGGSVTSFAWADNYVRAHIEFAIDEAVHRCADLALDLSDLATARWAALKGLELVPGCEQCFRRRFLVARAGNNRTELRRAMADLERVTAAELGEPEAFDMISEDLLALYHGLDQQLAAGSAEQVRL